jgi:hypothetical protein
MPCLAQLINQGVVHEGVRAVLVVVCCCRWWCYAVGNSSACLYGMYRGYVVWIGAVEHTMHCTALLCN